MQVFQCPDCPFKGSYATSLARHRAAKTCAYRSRRAALYRDGWAPTRSFARTLIVAQVPVRSFDAGYVATTKERWAPTWAVVVCASVSHYCFDGSPSKPGPNRGRVIGALLKLAHDKEGQLAVVTAGMLGGADAVCQLVRLKRENDIARRASYGMYRSSVVPFGVDREDEIWEERGPLWWLDPEEPER